MSRRGDNIRKRKDGRWEGRYIISRELNGKAVYRSVYGKTFTEVKKKLKEKESILQHSSKYTLETLDDAAISWLNTIKQSKKYSTYVKYENIYTKHIKDVFGKILLSNINEQKCVNFINSKRIVNINDSIGLSNSTLYSIKNVLTQIIKHGTDNKSFMITNERTINRNQKKLNEIQIFTKIEQQRMFDYLLDDIDNYKLGILICLFTGLRLGEICALRKSNINLENRTIQISETVQRIKSERPDNKTELLVSTPKTVSSNRLVPICDTLYNLLKDNLSDTDYVINGSTVMEPRTYQYYFKKLINSLSIDNKNFHCIRHTFATNCISSGMDVKCLSEILGHSDVKTTLNKYVHPTMEEKINQINSLSYNCGQLQGQIN